MGTESRISGFGVASGLGVLAISIEDDVGEDEDALIGAGSVSSESKDPVRPNPATIPITANNPSNRNGFNIFLRKFITLYIVENRVLSSRPHQELGSVGPVVWSTPRLAMSP